MIRAGELRERITIHGTLRVVDPRWGTSTAEVYKVSLWAKVEELKAEERMGAGGVQSDVTHRLTIRHRTDILDTFSIVWRCRRLEIASIIDPTGYRTELQITCREQAEVASA